MKKELASAVADAKAALEQRARILEELEKAEQERREIEGDIENTKARLGAAEADVALGGAGKAATAAKKALAQVREQAETIEARLDGLRDRLAQSDAELPERAKTLRQASHAAFEEELAKWLPGYLDEAKQFRTRVLEGLAVGAAFDRRITWLDAARDALNGSFVNEKGKLLAPVSPGRSAAPSFELAPDAEKTIERYAKLRELERTVKKLEQQLYEEEHERRREAQAAERQAQAVAS